MYYNIFEARPPRPWCSNRRCDCRKYLDEWITWRDLQEKIRDDYFPCYESVLLRDWVMTVGSDGADDKPRTIREGEENHLCILTTKYPSKHKTSKPKSSRFVFAMFIIHEIFRGDDDESGYVLADDYWRLEFRTHEAEQINFGDFYQNSDGSTRWSGLIRYFDDALAVKFLERAVEVKCGTPKEEDFARKFLNHYKTLQRRELYEV